MLSTFSEECALTTWKRQIEGIGIGASIIGEAVIGLEVGLSMRCGY